MTESSRQWLKKQNAAIVERSRARPRGNVREMEMPEPNEPELSGPPRRDHSGDPSFPGPSEDLASSSGLMFNVNGFPQATLGGNSSSRPPEPGTPFAAPPGSGSRLGKAPFASNAEVQVLINPDRCLPTLVWVNGLVCEANTNGYAHNNPGNGTCQSNNSVYSVGDSTPRGVYGMEPYAPGTVKPEWNYPIAFHMVAKSGEVMAVKARGSRNVADLSWHSRKYMLDGKFQGEGRTAGCVVSAPDCLQRAQELYPQGFTMEIR